MYVQPATSFEAILSAAPAGLVGQLGFSILQPSTATTVLARRTTGITEVATGVYWTEETAPVSEGMYLIIWDFGGTTATEELHVVASLPTFTPVVGGSYTTEADVRAYAPQITTGIGDDELATLIAQAEQDIDNALPFTYDITGAGRKIDTADLDVDSRRALSNATAAQVEYRLHVGPAFFIEGAQQITGGDITLTKPPKLLAPKARTELVNAGFIAMTGSMTRRVRPSLQRRFTW